VGPRAESLALWVALRDADIDQFIVDIRDGVDARAADSE
jgi:hypothetical protein